MPNYQLLQMFTFNKPTAHILVFLLPQNLNKEEGPLSLQLLTIAIQIISLRIFQMSIVLFYTSSSVPSSSSTLSSTCASNPPPPYEAPPLITSALADVTQTASMRVVDEGDHGHPTRDSLSSLFDEVHDVSENIFHPPPN
ncbi:unnamed protein product [Lepeophtheirus salmonis]|uniref:(salmon louse) hypothetical protein n=1 Tax=Lepeophtheirus salmonis TaxID=72036 RepID=A0A7R8CFK7_LEPSM|nr:unnamed protein product [Lepeophtheirus salmonis]CAF2807667.1 unnamed protein product [Lepeophtheirus salmonis]